MPLNIKAINDLYSERYIVTLQMIQKFQELISKEDFVFDESKEKLTTSILNSFLKEKESKEKAKK
jgi:hypothetical protein